MKTSFNHTRHKALWNWLADNPVKYYDGEEDELIFNEKDDVLLELEFDDAGEYACYACKYSNENYPEIRTNAVDYCPHCPLIWDNEEEHYSCYNSNEGNGLYNQWQDAENEEEKSKYARIIANLKVRPGIPTI